MRRSAERILTTHVGSIPRPPSLRDLLVRLDRGEHVDAVALEGETDKAIHRVVAQQLDAGIDVGNDGEQPRPGFSTYAVDRMAGFGGESKRPLSRDLLEFPDYGEMLAHRRPDAARISNAPQRVSEVRYSDMAPATRAVQ